MQRGNGQPPSQQPADIIQSVLAAAAASGMNQNQGNSSSTQNQLQLIMAQQQLVNPAGVATINTQQTGSQIRSIQGTPRRTGNFANQGTPQPSFIKVPVSPSGSILDATSSVQSGQAPLILQHGRLLQLPQTVNVVSSSPQQTIQTVQFQNTQGLSTMNIPVAITTSQLTTHKRPGNVSSGRSSNTRKSPATGSPSHASHMPSHPSSKMLKMQVQLPDNPRSDDLLELRRCVLLRKERELKELKENYTENLIELFFLQKDGNMMDFVAYRKRPTPQLVSFLQAQALDGSGGVRRSSSDSHKSKSSSSDKTSSSSSNSSKTIAATTVSTPPAASSDRKRTIAQAGLDDSTTGKSEEPPKTKVKEETHKPVAGGVESRLEVTLEVAKTATTPVSISLSIPSETKHKKTEPTNASNQFPSRPTNLISTPTPTSSIMSSQKSMTPSSIRKLTPPSAGRHPLGRQNSLVGIGAQEKIVERAKQEAHVMQRIGQLRKEGVWSARRLPKVQEPPRHKTHWDYLLEEMQWLAADFAGERRWKKATSRKMARAVAKHHQEQRSKMLKAERDEASRMRKIASNIAKEIKQFWSNIEKVVQYKQQSRLDERRKKALDLQLDFIVGQTEKYSSWLTEGLNVSTTGSSIGSVPSSPTRSIGETPKDDAEFQPEDEESDDETTIRVEEEEAGTNVESEENELQLLEKESQLPIQELLDSLPPEILEKPAELDASKAPTKESKEKEDNEFVPTDDEEEASIVDDEETMEEQEDAEGSQDHKAELDELAAEGELSIEDLMKKYAAAYNDEFEAELDSDDDDEQEEDDYDDDTITEEDTDESDEYDELEDIEDKEEGSKEAMDIEYLLNPDKENKQPTEESSSDSSPNNEITEFAATAQSIQPTGYTLETTAVKTKVPFLLRHTLREYQHIGLDWLVTMHEKRLNGILADEMGLGKTIQTIAVLAHLACEEGIWGPHLIVVPTSVMLNWEMELKKWCPAFKILTYFGNQKERKQKRQGWTKCNAFHVCITSYQLVIQDHQAFRRKKWKYLILDEAQNIKNFKSQRWQTLLNFNSQRRLLLTGTPLQNSLMELWSLMHFLMPHVFQSHREFKEWFANPVTGMIEGNTDYNEGLIKRLHKVLRPFLLRRLKIEVEKQLPKKYEHIVTCRLSKRQRYLYEDFMSRTKTKETLASGQFLSVINVLMQLRKVCNHPDLFELRPIVSSLTMAGIVYRTAALVVKALEYDPFKQIKFESFNLCLADHELNLAAYAAHRIKQLQTPRPLIEEIDSLPEPPARPNKVRVKPGKLFSHIPSKETGRALPSPTASTPVTTTTASATITPATPVVRSASPAVSHVLIKTSTGTILQRASTTPQGLVLSVSSQHVTNASTTVSTAASTISAPSSVTLVSPHTVPTTTQLQQLPGYTIPSSGVLQQRLILQPQGGGRAQFLTHPITVQLQGQHGTRIALPASQLRQLPQGGIVQIVQTASGQQILRGVQLATTTQVGQSSTNQQILTTSRPGSSQIQLLTQGLRATTAQSPRTQLLITTSGVNSSSGHVIKSSTAATQLLSAVNTVSSGKIQLSSNLPASLRPVVRVSPLNTDNLPASSTSILSKATVVSSPLPTVTLANSKTVTTSGLVLKVASQPSSNQNSAASLILSHPSFKTNSVANVSTTMSRKDSTPMAVVSPATAVRLTDVAKSVSSSDSKPKDTTTTSDTITTKAASGTAATVVTSMTTPKTSTTSLAKGRTRSSRGKVTESDPKKSPLYLESIVKEREERHKATLQRIADINSWRCGAKPVYGQDLCRAVSIINCLDTPQQLKNVFSGVGYFSCYNTHNHPTPNRSDFYFKTTKFLEESIETPEVKIKQLQPIFKRFMMTVNPVWAPSVSLHTSANFSEALHHNYIQDVLFNELNPRTKCLYHLQNANRLQFPELRLIQYDCGKLQTLDVLLRRLKPNGHRVLIFTQMTKMLDVLEKFLNFHGHTYLRLDGATKVEARQMLMERFNADKRIFCFILSTRSGGLGINLTGADTVVFYDSDWNPTMDAQAQDRCHRIGQTRDVHIYRLVSEMTIEENILKKAHQKRLLADVSIEGGNFTTAFFKKHALTELFEKPDEPESKSELEVAKTSQSSSATVKELPTPVKSNEVSSKEDSAAKMPPPEKTSSAPKPDLSQIQLEQALSKAEDETDVQAASMAHAEQVAELAEFDETIPFDGEEKSINKEEPSRVEIELAQLDEQLTPIEKYALVFLESTVAPLTDDQLVEAEEQVEIAKKEWELSHLQALKEEEERKAEMEEDEIFYTYTREDAYNKIYISQTNKIMPMWAPPTPPQDDTDVYLDHAMYVMYEPSVMTETQLPSIYTKKEHKKTKEINVATVRKPKTHSKGDHMQPPRSLFDRPSSAWHKMRRDAKQQKMRDMVKPMKPLPTVHKPEIDTQQDRPEWLINEDWALLQTIQTLLELPLSLQVLVPGHTINWELVSDVVNSCSRIYRSPKQCKNRYESVIVPREEGKILYDTNPKKQKKSKGLYKSLTKNNRPMKTSHLHTQDNNSSHTMLYSNKFDQIRLAVSKRQPYLKQVLNNPLLKNPKHSAVLQDYSINYDKPLLPLQVAAKRADRIAKEKKEKEAQIKQTAAQNAAAAAAKTTAVATAASTTVLASTVARTGNSIVVNTQGGVVSVTGQQIASINKRLNQPLVTSANVSQIATSIAQIVRTQGGRATQVTLPTSAIQVTQARPTTTASIMVSTVSGVTTVQARVTPTTSLASAAMVKATTSNLPAATISTANLTTAFNAYKRQAQAQAQPTTIKQQFKQVDLKRIQQAQAQAKAAQAEAHAQAQASQQLVTSGSSSAVVASIVQQQRVQKPATLTRPLKEAEISLIKRQLQQHKLNQSANKVAVTTVSGVTVSGVVTVGQQKGQTLKQLTFTPQQLRTLQMQQLLRQKKQQIQTLTPQQAAQLTQKAQFLASQQQKLQAARLVAQVQQGGTTQHIQVPTLTTAQQVQKAVQSGQVQVQQTSGGQTTVQQIPRQQLIQLSRTGNVSTALALQQTSKPITVISSPSTTLNASQLAQVVSVTNAQKLQSSGQTTHVVSIAPPMLQSGSGLQTQVVRAAGLQEAVSKAAQSVAINVTSPSQAKMDVIMIEQHGATETVMTEPPSPAESTDSKKEESQAGDLDPSSSTSTRSYTMRTRTQSKH